MYTTPSLNLGNRDGLLARTTHPVVIAGPCSAESESQMLQTAQGLMNMGGISVFRAGIWKPRTRPGSFQGMGTTGLEWLKTVKQETGLRTACEVASTHHVTEALKHEVDILIIGAHTTVNPFLVQEIADALQGVTISVLVKNPVNPDLLLWLGALERLHACGVSDLGAMHRGFDTLDNAPYRNHPKWDHVLELKSQYPELPVYCDASHIAGRRSLLRPVCQRAMDLGYDGLMVETHHNPAAALSDAGQQLMPQELNMLLQAINYKTTNPEAACRGVEIEELRKQIEYLDDELLDLLSRRNKVSAKMERFPKTTVTEAPQVVHWELVLDSLLVQANQAGVDQSFVQSVFQEVRRHYATTYLYQA